MRLERQGKHWKLTSEQGGQLRESLFILLAYTLEAITGFGSSLGALLRINELLPVLLPLNVGTALHPLFRVCGVLLCYRA